MQDIRNITKERIDEVLRTFKHTPHGSVEASESEYGMYRHTGAAEEQEQHLPRPDAPSFEAQMKALKERQRDFPNVLLLDGYEEEGLPRLSWEECMRREEGNRRLFEQAPRMAETLCLTLRDLLFDGDRDRMLRRLCAAIEDAAALPLDRPAGSDPDHRADNEPVVIGNTLTTVGEIRKGRIE